LNISDIENILDIKATNKFNYNILLYICNIFGNVNIKGKRYKNSLLMLLNENKNYKEKIIFIL